MEKIKLSEFDKKAMFIGGDAGVTTVGGIVLGNYLNSKFTGNWMKYGDLGLGAASFFGAVIFRKHAYVSVAFLGLGLGLIISGLGVFMPKFKELF